MPSGIYIRTELHRKKISQGGKGKSGRKKGTIPWNKNKKGVQVAWNKGKKVRLNPKGEFKKGHKTWNKGKKLHYSAWNKGKSNVQTAWNRGIFGKKSHAWKGGKSKEPYSFDFTTELKELIRKRDNYICQLCSKKWNENCLRFTVHHIDYDKKNCNPINLTTLCRKCNSKVNFNREHWKQYFLKNK